MNIATRSVAFKLSSVALASLLVVLTATMALVSNMVWQSAATASRASVVQAASQLGLLVKTMDEGAQTMALRDFGLLSGNFTGPVSLSEQPGADGKTEAVLSFGGTPVNGNFDVVDRFSKDDEGAVATIFARTGDDFIRVTTSLRNPAGQRAYKTLLDRNHPAYALLLDGKTYIGRATLFGRDYMTVYKPIREGNRTIGIIFTGTDIGRVLQTVNDLMAAQKLFRSGTVYAVDVSAGPARGRLSGVKGDTRSAVDEKTPEGKAWMDTVSVSEQSASFEDAWSPRQPGDAATRRFVAVERYRPWNWAIVAEAPVSELMAEARMALTWLWLGVAVALALLAAVLVLATRRIVGAPVQQLSAALAHLAQGDLRHAVSVRSQDEIGTLAQAMDGFRTRLQTILGTVRSSAESVSHASAEIAQGNQDLSSRTESQAASLEETSSSMEELGATIRHNADGAAQASDLAEKARQVAVEGGQVVSQLVETMHGIDSGSLKIADIIGVIDGIAFQTNILALNAAVEAARAGEQGRGFAVVAAEVRSLAQRTAGEARTIKELIGASNTLVQQGSGLADRAGATMQQIVGSIQDVASMVAEIRVAGREQTTTVGHVGEAVTQLDQVTQQNAALVEEMAAAAAGLRTQAEQMVDAVSRFRLGPV